MHMEYVNHRRFAIAATQPKVWEKKGDEQAARRVTARNSKKSAQLQMIVTFVLTGSLMAAKSPVLIFLSA
jgi:hypothetical protein